MHHWLNLGFIREVEQLVDLAVAAEEAGFAGVTLPHRWIMPADVQTRYPYTKDGSMFWPADTPFVDPWVAIGAMAARTTRIRLATNIYLMALADPFAAARQVATASILSGGRVVCGVAAGWMREEYDLVGVDYKSRGRRLNEMIAVVRKLWSGEPVSHEGAHIRFPEVVLSPAPKAEIPIWCGGASKAALRRVADHCQGWLGLWYPADEAIAKVTELTALRADSPRADEPLEALIGLVGKPDPDTVGRLEAAGVTGLIATPWRPGPQMAPLEAKLAAIEGYAKRFVTPSAP